MSAAELREAAAGLRDEWGDSNGGPRPMGTAWHRERDFHLAVAKAMDDVADAWEIADGWALDLDDDPIRFEDTLDGGWLAVARAYLGSAQ